MFHFVSTLRQVAACSLLLLGATAAAWAADEGILRGSVSDPHHAQVAGAQVTIINQASKQVYHVRTDAQGNYSMTGLPAGNYQVQVAVRGFKAETAPSVAVNAGQETAQNFALALGGTAQSVDVNANLENDVRTQTPAALLGLVESAKNDDVTFTAKDIEALHPANILEIFQQVPGMDVSYQGRQHMDFLAMRGGNFQIVVDGIYMSQTDRLLATIPVQQIESITIVRDSTALSIGPLTTVPWGMGNGTSGVGNQGFVIVKTKRSPKLDVGFVSNGASYGTAMGHVYAGSKSGNWDYRGTYTYMTSQGRNGWNMQYRTGAASFHGGYTTEKTKFDFLYYGSRGYRNEEFGTNLLPYSVSNKYQIGQLETSTFNIPKQNVNMFALNASQNWNAKNRTVLQYGFTSLDVTSQITNSTRQRQNDTEANFDLKHTYRLKGHDITGGVQYLKYIAPFGSSGSTTARTDEAMLGWYAQDEFKLLDKKLTFDYGIRGDKTHNGWNTSLKKTSDAWSSEYLTLAFGAGYKLTPKTTLSARYGFVDSPVASNYWYMNGSVLQSASSLPNQQQNRGELSVKSEWKPYFKPSATFYVYDTANGVTTYASGCPLGTSWDDASGNEQICVSSAGDVKTVGTELAVNGKLYGPVNYNAGYSYLATDNTSSNASMTHNYVNAGLNFRQGIFFGNFDMIYQGPRSKTTSTIGTIEYVLGDFTRYDANGGVNFKSFSIPMTLTVFGRNLGDNNYATRYSTGAYLDPGRTWGVELAGKVF